MKNSRLLKRLLLLRDEYGEPKLHLGGVYSTLDRHVAVCSQVLYPQPDIQSGAMSLREFMTRVQKAQAVAEDKEPEAYGLIIIGYMPSSPVMDKKMEPLKRNTEIGVYVDPEGFCLEDLRYSVAYELEYYIKAKFPRIKPHRGNYDE